MVRFKRQEMHSSRRVVPEASARVNQLQVDGDVKLAQ